MDDRNGQIHSAAQVRLMSEMDRMHMHKMKLEPTIRQQVRGKVGRNEPCPCGSGKKFKRCHLLLGRKLP